MPAGVLLHRALPATSLGSSWEASWRVSSPPLLPDSPQRKITASGLATGAGDVT